MAGRTCSSCGRMTITAGAKFCSWCSKPLKEGGPNYTTSLNFHRAVRECANLLRQLTPKDQEDAIQWLSQSLRLKESLEQGEKSGSSASSTPAASSETDGPESPGSSSSSDEPEGSLLEPGSPSPTTSSSPTASRTPPSNSSGSGGTDSAA